MEYSRILYSVSQRIATITLNWPEKNNSLDDSMVTELASAFLKAQRDTNVKAVILQASGDTFCAGVDISYIQRISKYDFKRSVLPLVIFEALF